MSPEMVKPKATHPSSQIFEAIHAPSLPSDASNWATGRGGYFSKFPETLEPSQAKQETPVTNHILLNMDRNGKIICFGKRTTI